VEDLRKEVEDPSVWQQILNLLQDVGDRNIPPGGASGLATEGGPGRVTGPEVETGQPLRSQGNSSGSGWTRPPKADVVRITKLKESYQFFIIQLQIRPLE
jgi:hypothetical protein